MLGALPVRAIGALLLALLVVCMTVFPNAITSLRLASFDLYQQSHPRARRSNPVRIVAIDEPSIARYGQWPWPRSTLAQLIERIADARPAAVGLDIIMPEPDANSPEQLAARVTDTPAKRITNAEIATRLRQLPHNDAVLAERLTHALAVLGVGLLKDSQTVDQTQASRNNATHYARAAPTAVLWADQQNGSTHLIVRADSLRSLPELEDAAAGLASLSAEPDGGVVRRVPLLARTGDTLWPLLGIEMLRVVAARQLIAHADANGINAIEVAGINVPTDADARYWLYFAPPQSSRVISAADVLAGNVAQLNELSNHLVLVGFYAEGLQDVISTPLGDRRAGVEAHAELIENIFDRQMLARPHWAGKAEAFMFLFWSSLAIWLVPLGRPLRSIALFSGAIVLLLGAGFALFRAQGMLFDVATPALGILVTFGSMLALTLAESDRRRRLLAGALAVQREQQARFEGELAAAQRIQMGLLPQPKVALAGDTRADIAAFIEPARSIGGDLYDFFKLDDDHLFIAIGDVSGKGVPASLFMALAKSLTKSSALRDDTDLALKISRAQTEITRDNPEFMFITLVALVLNLRTGHLRYVNAGHETPLIVNADGARLLEEGGGPPLCVMDDFVFTSAETHLARNDLLVLVTDGVTEALDPKDNLYGRERLNRTLRAHVTADATAVIAALRADVLTFADGTELPDDLAVVAVRYLG